MSDELQFNLRGWPVTEEDCRRFAGQVLFTLRPNPAFALAVAALNEQAARSTAGMLCSIGGLLARDFAHIGASFGALRGGYAADFAVMADSINRFVLEGECMGEQTCRMVAQAGASMPEEAREELRSAIEDAPLCEVHVNASDAGVM